MKGPLCQTVCGSPLMLLIPPLCSGAERIVKGIYATIIVVVYLTSLFKLPPNMNHSSPTTLSARFPETESDLITIIPQKLERPADASYVSVRETSPTPNTEMGSSGATQDDHRSTDADGPSKQSVNTDRGSKQALRSCLKKQGIEFPSFPDTIRETVKTSQ